MRILWLFLCCWSRSPPRPLRPKECGVGDWDYQFARSIRLAPRNKRTRKVRRCSFQSAPLGHPDPGKGKHMRYSRWRRPQSPHNTTRVIRPPLILKDRWERASQLWVECGAAKSLGRDKEQEEESKRCGSRVRLWERRGKEVKGETMEHRQSLPPQPNPLKPSTPIRFNFLPDSTTPRTVSATTPNRNYNR